ncbi:MAG TPA: DUF2970 domain-containing protein [Burkholderiaceae bacterium]
MTEPTGVSPARRKGSLLRTVKAVAWSFVGLRRGSDYREDIDKLNPLHIMAVGFVAVLLFVLALIGLVNWVA